MNSLLPMAAATLGMGLACLTMPGSIPAQDRVVTVQNLAPHPRQEWAGVVVPFSRGVVQGLPDLHLEDHATVWQPIGARWDDGSLRQALALFPARMKALGEQALRLRPGSGPALPTASIVDPLRTGRVRVSVRVTSGETTATARPEFVELLEENAARHVALYRCRLGATGLLFEMIVTAHAGQAHSYADVAVFFSDPRTKAVQCAVDSLTVHCEGMELSLRHSGLLGVSTERTAAGSTTTLLEGRSLADGQGIRRVGVLTPEKTEQEADSLRAARLIPILAATSWRGSDAYGPFGFVPEAPPWLRGNAGRAALARRHADFVRAAATAGDPFAVFGFGLAKNAGQTGNQGDFGILKLAPVAATGMPSFLYEVEPSVLQEACRPVHFFEADGAPIRAAAHPQWVVWDGRTHWNCEASKDRLGKPCPCPRFDSHGWHGKDRQHWSSNYLCGLYLLTGTHWARREIDNEVQLFLGIQQVKPGVVTAGIGAPRAAGRMLLAGCWLYQATGDAALLERMHERLEKSHLPGWAGREFPDDHVRPLAIRRPDPRALDGKFPYWSPWEESIAVLGYAAFYEMTGSAVAEQLADALSRSVLDHGWRISGQGAHVGYVQAFQAEGRPLTEAEKQQATPLLAAWAGGGISEWSMGAVEVARVFAERRGDQARARRAAQILALLRAGRSRAPKDGWWDDYREWDAVRIQRGR